MLTMTINNIVNRTLILDPLEQFELSFYSFSFLFNSFCILLIINSLLFLLFFRFGSLYNNSIFSFIFDFMFNFFKSVFLNILGFKNQSYFYFYFYLFLFIFLNNLIGMFSFTYTLTSFFIISFFFSFLTVLGTLYIGFEKNRFQFLGYFLPKGVPVLILYFLIIIELISYIIRLFSLAIRLFANMVAGHALLKILLSFIWLAFSSLSFFSGLSIVFWILLIIITILEILISFLQAYVFVFLGLIYLSEVL